MLRISIVTLTILGETFSFFDFQEIFEMGYGVVFAGMMAKRSIPFLKKGSRLVSHLVA